MEITKDLNISIMGMGKVGMSIAQAFAQSGFRIQGFDINQENIDRGLKKVIQNLEMLVSKGKIENQEKEAIINRMTFTTQLDQIVDADVIVEAVFEEIETKKELFRKIDNLVKSKDALLLTNTSSLSVSEIAAVTKRPGRVAGMHFFNPVPVMKLVEVVKGTMTTSETIEEVKALGELMGKTTILSSDSPAFIVNRMLNAMLVEGAKIVEEGVGTVEDVDTGVKLGLGHPMGPFELIDFLNAIPLVLHVTDYMTEELGDRFRMPVWVKNLGRAGLTGRETGKGYYDYSED